MEDRSALFNQLKNFSQRKLKKVETKVVTASGEQLVEKRGAKGLQVLSGSGADGSDSRDAEPARKLDLQVGLVLPGFLIASQDVAHDKSSLDGYGVTHILNLDANVENKFEDDYNYKNIAIQDKPEFELERILEDCFDFIDDGRHYGNVLVHCSGTIGLSRSTAICIAYLMNKEKQKLDEAFNNVKEVRSFVKPNEGFMKQLRDYEIKLRGAQQVKESGIDDPFALRKKQEIEQEKAMVAGAASVKNRMKMFGANLDTTSASSPSSSARSKSVSPAPSKMLSSSASNGNSSATSTTGGVASKWAPVSTNSSKSMTPEPRKSWQSPAEPTNRSSYAESRDKPGAQLAAGPPPPPPPMPTTSLHGNDKSIKLVGNNCSAGLPPPPPPPPAPGDLLKSEHRSSTTASKPRPPSTSTSTTPTSSAYRKQSVSETSDDDTSKQKLVFGRRPPPPMKIRGGLSIERQDSIGDRNSGVQAIKSSTQSKASLQLPLKKQFTTDSDGESGISSSSKQSQNPRAPSPSAALRAAKQQMANSQQQDAKGSKQNDSSSASDHRRPSKGQLNRSSTKKLLNLIKTKTRSDLTLPDGDENDEIDALLGALENESIENIDWDELGLDEDEVKDIIRSGGDDVDASTTSSSSEDETEEDEDEEEEVETSTQHYVIRTKY